MATNWLLEAEGRLSARYALTFADVGFSPTELASLPTSGQTPEAWVDWFGEKYNLTDQ